MYKLADTDTKILTASLRESRDHVVAKNILTTLGSRANQMRYAIDTRSDAVWSILIDAGFRVFTQQHVTQCLAQSRRITDITVIMAKAQIKISVAKHVKSTPRFVYTPPKKRKCPVVTIDWATAGIADDDDIECLEGIMGHVYNIHEMVPDIRAWVEPVYGTGATRKGVDIPLSSDISESDVSESGVPEGECVGYALCFTRIPDMSGIFLTWLVAQYGSRIAHAYIWIDVPARVASSPLLVVIVRRAACTIAQTHAAMIRHIPKGGLEKHRKLA